MASNLTLAAVIVWLIWHELKVRRLEALTRAILDQLSRETPPESGI
jgi:hypothetical protein